MLHPHNREAFVPGPFSWAPPLREIDVTPLVHPALPATVKSRRPGMIVLIGTAIADAGAAAVMAAGFAFIGICLAGWL